VSEPGSLASRTARGLTWSYGAILIQIGLVFLLTVTLARLLTPTEFGLVAAANVVIGFGQYFAQLGLGQALVQRASIDDRDIRVTFASALGLGVVFYAVCWLVAPGAAVVFHHESIVPVLRVLGLVFVGSALSVTSSALLRRELRIRTMTIVDVAAFAFGYAAPALTLAALGAGAWSLVAGYVTQSFATAIGYYAVTRHPLRPVWDRAVVGRLYSFGSRVSVIGFFEFLAGNLDSLWTGHVLGTRKLGLYNRAFNLVSVPVFYAWSSFAKVGTSSFSRIQSDRERIRTVFLPVLTVFLALTWPALWGLAGASHVLVAVLLGARWRASAAPLSVLALAAPLWLAACLVGMLCQATARLSAQLRISGSQVVLLVVLLALLGRSSIVGVAAAIAISQTWAFVWYLRAMARFLGCDRTALAAVLAPGAAAGVLAGGACLALSAAQHAGFLPLAGALALQVAAGLVISAAVLLRGFRGRVWRQARGLADATIGEGPSVVVRVLTVLDGLAASPASAGERG